MREVGRQAEQQRYREEAAARQAEREEAARQAVLAEYVARTCPCCPNEIENRTEEEQELIEFLKYDGIHSEINEDGIQISVSFYQIVTLGTAGTECS